MVQPSEGFDQSPAEVRIETVQWNGQGRLAVIGEIDLSNVRTAEAELLDVVSSGTPITLDLVGLSYIDSQGVSMLFRLAERARLNGGSLTLANPHDLVLRVLELTHVEDAAEITHDV